MASYNKITQRIDSTFDVNNLQFTKPEENPRSKGNKIAWPRFKNSDGSLSSLVFQTPFIPIDHYGIPSIGDYYKDDKARCFVKIPIDPKVNDEIKQMHDKLEEIDKYLGDEGKKKEEIFGSAKNAKQFKYQQILRTPMQMETVDSDSDSEGEQNDVAKDVIDRPKYIKANFRTDYETGKMQTKFYMRKKIGDKTIREEIEGVESISDAEKFVKYKGNIRFVMIPNKLWVMKNYEGKKYGMSFKITHIEVEEQVMNSNMKQIYEGDAFISDSEDDELDNSYAASKEEQVEEKVEECIEAEDSDLSSDEEESLSDEKEMSKAPKKTRGKTKKVSI